MTRTTLLLTLLALPALAQLLKMGEASEGFVSLFNGQDLGRWVGDPQQWKPERGLLIGTSSGTSTSALVLDRRDYGDGDFRFDVQVKRGSALVQVRGQGKGPEGVTLEIGTSVVRWLVNGSPALVIANSKPGEWKEVRIVSQGNRFEVFLEETRIGETLVVGHSAPRGKLALLLPAGSPSEVSFRNLRLKE